MLPFQQNLLKIYGFWPVLGCFCAVFPWLGEGGDFVPMVDSFSWLRLNVPFWGLGWACLCRGWVGGCARRKDSPTDRRTQKKPPLRKGGTRREPQGGSTWLVPGFPPLCGQKKTRWTEANDASGPAGLLLFSCSGAAPDTPRRAAPAPLPTGTPGPSGRGPGPGPPHRPG